MSRYFIALETFEHQIDCFCPNGEHADFFTIGKGDIIEVMKERKFIMDNGWYFFVTVNDQYMFYIALEDLEEYAQEEWLVSMLDIELKINYLQFQINQALDTGDEACFLKETKKLKEWSEYKVNLDEYVNNIAV